MTEITSLKVRVAAFWVGSLLLVQRLSEFIRSTFLARWFTREEMGMVAIMLMLHSGIRVFSEMGHYAAVVQRTEDRLDDAVDTSFVASAIRGVALTVLLAAVALPVAAFYREPRLGGLILASSFVFLLSGFENKGILYLHRRVELKAPKLVDAAATTAELLVTVAIAVLWNSIWCVVFGALSARGVALALTHLVSPRRSRFRFDKEIFWELFHYGRNIWGVAVLVFLVTQLDNAVIGRVLDLERLSLYVIAYSLANLPITNIVGVANQVAFPTWSDVVRRGDIASRDRMFLDTVRFTGALSFAICAAMFVGGADLLETIFGEKWRAAEPALQILVVFGLIRGISANFGTLFNSLGRPNLIMREISVKVVIIVATIYHFTLWWGIRGASLAVTLPMVVITPIAAMIYLRIAGISRLAAAATLARPTAATAALVGLWLLVKDSPWLQALPAPVRGLGWFAIAIAVVVGACWLGDEKLRRAVRRNTKRPASA